MSNITHIHIAIADPSAIVREGIISIIRRINTLSVDIVEIAELDDLRDKILEFQPDLLIVNQVNLGVLTPAKLREELLQELASVKIVALQSAIHTQELSKIGYDEVISIYDDAEAIETKLLNVVEQKQGDGDSTEAKSELSAREREIICCVVKGMTNKQIAESLFLSTHTVIAHRRNIANKLQIHSPAGLTIYAIVNKLVDISEVKNTILKR